MATSLRHVTIKQVPPSIEKRHEKAFLREIKRALDIDGPRVVLDCSNLAKLNRSVAMLMLQCLEEAMKCRGDVKLAALQPKAVSVLESIGISHLFDIYDTTDEAVESYQLPTYLGSPVNAAVSSKKEDAA